MGPCAALVTGASIKDFLEKFDFGTETMVKGPHYFASSFPSRLPNDMYHVMLNRSNIRMSLCETSSRHRQAEGGGGEGHREEVDEGGVGGLIGKTPTHLSCLY